MSKVRDVSGLLSLQDRAQQNAEETKLAYEYLRKVEKSLYDSVREYREERIALFEKLLNDKGLTWCTACPHHLEPTVFSLEEAKLIFERWKLFVSHGYGNAHESLDSGASFHRVCPECFERAMSRHGMPGRREGEIWHTFLVEKYEKGYFALQFGTLVKLSDEQTKLSPPSSKLVSLYEEEFNLTPEIEYLHAGAVRLFPEILVHERQKVASSV